MLLEEFKESRTTCLAPPSPLDVASPPAIPSASNLDSVDDRCDESGMLSGQEFDNGSEGNCFSIIRHIGQKNLGSSPSDAHIRDEEQNDWDRSSINEIPRYPSEPEPEQSSNVEASHGSIDILCTAATGLSTLSVRIFFSLC